MVDIPEQEEAFKALPVCVQNLSREVSMLSHELSQLEVGTELDIDQKAYDQLEQALNTVRIRIELVGFSYNQRK